MQLAPRAFSGGALVVALRSQTGELVRAFQTVHHNVWDYDLPAQPTLAHIATEAGGRDGFLFVLDKRSGQLVRPVEAISRPRNSHGSGGISAGADGEPKSLAKVASGSSRRSSEEVVSTSSQ
jgi:glucose dehydrogenase